MSFWPQVGFFRSGAAVASLTSLNYALGDTSGGGQSIVITGTNLSGATSVLFGATSATITGNTSTTVTVTLPSHLAGAVSVSVTTAAGVSSNTLTFTYWSPSQITSIAAYYDAEKGVTLSGSNVSALADQSGAGIGLTATTGKQPAYTASAFGTLHGLTYDGTKRLIAGARQSTSAQSYFVVAKWTSTTSTTTNYANNAPLTMVGDSTGSVANAFGASAGALVATDAFTPTNNFSRGSGLNDGSPHLVGVTLDSGSTTAKIYSGGTQQGTAGVIGHAPGWDSLGAGYSAANNGDGFVGAIGAAILVAAVISGPDLLNLNAWAQQRFGTS